MARVSKDQEAPLEGQERWWWTTAEVAEAWEVSERTIYRWLEEGRFTEGRSFHRATPQGTGAYLWTEVALPDWVDS